MRPPRGVGDAPRAGPRPIRRLVRDDGTLPATHGSVIDVVIKFVIGAVVEAVVEAVDEAAIGAVNEAGTTRRPSGRRRSP